MTLAFEPRMLRSTFAGAPISSWPLNLTEPVASPLPARRPIAAMNIWLLPEPDSPTTPTTSPLAMSKVAPLTAWTMPSGVLKRTWRSWI